MPSFHPFEDRSDLLFGRQPDIDYLLERVQHTGLTAVYGRPQKGKTWLLEQVGWILENQQKHLVGYNESRGETSDHLLRAVIDLYSRWVASASSTKQIESIFNRHKKELTTGAGVQVAKALSEFIPGGGLIKIALDGLSSWDSDLKTARSGLAPLDYDKALELTNLVHEESGGKPIVLILDAWEKSQSVQTVYDTLDSFLKHADDWPPCHMVLGIRKPELHRPKKNTRSYELVEDLGGSSVLAELKELLPMQLKETTEQERMLAHLRALAPAAQDLDDQDLLGMIDGFPGVIQRIRIRSKKEHIQEEQILHELAADAHAYRYREFDKLLPPLRGDERIMAIRIALFHRLDASSWKVFRDILCAGIAPRVWGDLRNAGVFEAPQYPSYGHDTRHEDAFRRLLDLFGVDVQTEFENLLCSLTSRIRFIDDRDRDFGDALAA